MSPITFSAVYLPLLLSALALFVCVVSFLFLRAYIKRRTSREWIMQEGIITEIREEVNNLLKSIDEATDRDITLITEREKSLRILLAEVDKRLKVYIREMEKRPVQQPESAGSGGTYVDLGKLRYRIKKQEPAPEQPQADEVKTENTQPAGDQINSMLKSGFSKEIIASRLGLSIAEVEFTAALLERRGEKIKT